MISPSLWLLVSVLTSQLALSTSFYEALPLYQTLLQAEKIIAQGGYHPAEVPDELLPVFWCESKLVHSYNGKIVRSKTNDIGISQINLKSWAKKAKEMQLDLYLKNDNLAFALYLYEQNGLKDWSASRKCWSKFVEISIL